MANRLARESSPYLRQHADNPVDWYPWGEEALERARREDKPILLSIGYSACHWCHVMAHESFEDGETARAMNERFVCVKVDREEMPDLDQIYQQALALQGESGGWPLTMFLTPEGLPFYGGTYFPPRDSFGRPAFRRLLAQLGDAYHQQRAAVTDTAGQFRAGLKQIAARPSGESPLRADAVDRAVTKLSLNLDRREGGFGGAPKFPNPKAMELLLRGARRLRRHAAGDPEAADLVAGVSRTLLKMAEGGIYDQVGGGFARYSTDAVWLVPHFEKMLYDNAQLLGLYAEAYQLTKEPTFTRVVRETAGYIERELRAPEGGLYTAQDADSEGVEGKYYVWTPAEVRAIVGAEAAAVFARCYGVVEGGNWRDPHGHAPPGASILHVVDRPRDPGEQALLERAKTELLAARSKRVPPGLDNKILASSNGLAIAGLAEAGRILGDTSLIEGARRTADFVLGRMRGPDGRLRRTYSPAKAEARLPGTLDDHAFVADGLIALYEATHEGRWLEAAHRLTAQALELFYDASEQVFYLTAASDPGLIQRPVSLHDSAIPSGMSVCLENLIRLGSIAGDSRWLEVAGQALQVRHDQALSNPFGFSNLLSALDLYQERPAEIVLAGGDLTALERALAGVYLPNRVIVAAPGAPSLVAELVRDKEAPGGRAAAFVCRGFTCQRPETDPATLAASLTV